MFEIVICALILMVLSPPAIVGWMYLFSKDKDNFWKPPKHRR